LKESLPLGVDGTLLVVLVVSGQVGIAGSGYLTLGWVLLKKKTEMEKG
jgi:hypothetical protein